MILMGVFATYFMDLIGSLLHKKKLIHSLVEPEVVGRWFLYLFKGKFVHEDIYNSTALNNEKVWSFIFHYLIGIILAGIYLFLDLKVSIIHNHLWMPLVFGIATVILPWFVLFPGMGLGFLASKTPNRLSVIKTNLVHHTNFGIGLFIWAVSFHRLFT